MPEAVPNHPRVRGFRCRPAAGGGDVAVVMHVGADDWRQVRFAVSPLHETTAVLRLIRGVLEGRLVPTRPWELAAVRRAEHLPLAPLLALLPTGRWNPDVLNPPPSGPREDFGDELGQVAAVDAETFAAEVSRCLVGQGRAVEHLPAAAVQRDEAVGLLELAWHELLLPQWSRLHDVLSADVAVRGAALAAGGLAAVLTDLHPQVRLVGTSIIIGTGGVGEVELGGRGLTLLPTAWAGGLGCMWNPPWRPALTYPARGTSAALATPTSDSLGRLLGRTRAAVLTALTDPATTSGLAHRCNLPLSTASDHLAALRAARLVTTHRVGHALQHRRTDLGDAVLFASDTSAQT